MQDELIYLVRYENDVQSLQKVMDTLDQVEKKTAQSPKGDDSGKDRLADTLKLIEAQIELQKAIDATKQKIQEKNKALKESVDVDDTGQRIEDTNNLKRAQETLDAFINKSAQSVGNLIEESKKLSDVGEVGNEGVESQKNLQDALDKTSNNLTELSSKKLSDVGTVGSEGAESQKSLQSALNETAESINDLNSKKLADVGGVDADAIQSQVELTDSIKATSASIKELNDSEKAGVALTDEQKKSREELALQLKTLRAEYSGNQRNLIALSTEVKDTSRTYNDLTARNKQLSVAMRSVPLDDTTGQLDKLKAEYKENNDALKAFDKSIGNNQRNVGNYKEAVTEALEETGLFSTQIKAVKDVQKGLEQGLKVAKSALFSFSEGATGAQKAFQLFNNVVKFSAIGLLVTTLAGLVAFLTKSQRGIDLVAGAMGALNAVVGKVTDQFIKVGEVIVDAFSNPQQALKDLGDALLQNVINRLLALGQIIDAIVNRDAKALTDATFQLATGFTNVTDKTEAFTAELSKAAVEGFNLARAEKEIFRTETDLLVLREKLRAQVKEDNKIAEDTTKSLEDRIDAARRAIDAENKLAQQAEALALKRLNLIIAQNAISESTDEDLRKQAEAEAELFRIRQENAERTTTLNNKLNILSTTYEKIGVRIREAGGDADFFNKIIGGSTMQVESAINALKSLSAATAAEIEKLKAAAGEDVIIDDEIDLDIKIEPDFLSPIDLEREYLKESILATSQAEQQRLEILAQAEREKKRLIDLGLTEEQAAAKVAEQIEMRKTQIAAAESAIRANQAVSAAQTLVSLGSQVFEDSKALSVASALINTYQSATAAYKSLAGIPVVGPGLGAAAAGLAVAAGLKQVEQIKNTTIGSSGVGGNPYGRGRGSTSLSVASSASPQSQAPNLTVTNELNIDERGIALATRSGESQLRSEQVNFTG